MKESNNIADLFFDSARKYPDKIAIVHNDKKISYKELTDEVLKTAAYLKQQGIGKGDRVLIFISMSIDLYRFVLALFSIGAVAVFLDEWVSKSRMEICCSIARCKGFVGVRKARVLRWFSKELRAIPMVLKINDYMNFQAGDRKESVLNTTPDDTALITFTTGSTGTPKAAKRTHGFLKEQFDALIEKIQPRPDDVDMPVLPIVLLINLGAGATSVITDYKASKPHSFDPEKIEDEILQHKVNRITASPYFIRSLSAYLVAYEKTLAVEKIFTGGAPVFPSEAALYQKAFPKTVIQIVYGSTEAEPISSVSSTELLSESEKSLTQGLPVGIPYHKAEVKIIPISGEAITVSSIEELITCSTGGIGEIIVAGPHVLKEYINNEEALKRNKIFVEGKVYHRTGDSGFLDTNGKLYLTGRCSTLFKQNGSYVAPFLWENYFQTLPGIAMGTVLQKNDRILVVIELNDATQKNTIEKKLEQLPIHTDSILFLKKIPRDPRHNSKIDYEKLLIAIQ